MACVHQPQLYTVGCFTKQISLVVNVIQLSVIIAIITVIIAIIGKYISQIYIRFAQTNMHILGGLSAIILVACFMKCVRDTNKSPTTQTRY